MKEGKMEGRKLQVGRRERGKRLGPAEKFLSSSS
jgi:hypothetical protein